MRHLYWPILLLAVMILSLSRPGAAQWSSSIEVNPPLGSHYSPPTTVHPPWCRPIQVRIEANRLYYQVGDPVSLSVRASEDAYIFVYSDDGSGRTHQLFPNYYDQDNFVRAGRTLRLPTSRFRLAASGEGWDTITAIAISPAETGWRPPSWARGGSERDPFLQWRRGTSEARQRLEADLNRAVQDRREELLRREQRRSPRVQVAPELPYYEQPCWGESSTRIYVRPRLAFPGNPWQPVPPGYVPPPPPPDYRPPGYVPPRPGGNASIELRSVPSGADIYLDGRYYGRTPRTLRIEEGRYEVELIRSGYRPWRAIRVLEEGVEERVSVRLERAR